jgi:uncharacterized membrane protein
MGTRVTIAGHPIHPMLVTIPIGLWVFSLFCDFVYAGTGDPRWETTAYFTLGGGIVGALLAAVPGFFDFLGLHEARERRVATTHLVLNLSIVVVQAISFWLRSGSEPAVGTLPILLSAISVATLVLSGWLGGHLVHVLGVTQPRHEEQLAFERERMHPRT